MVISFEEKDRQKIEATGMNIIQVKRAIHISNNFLKSTLKKMIEYVNNLSPEQKEKLLKHLKE